MFLRPDDLVPITLVKKVRMFRMLHILSIYLCGGCLTYQASRTFTSPIWFWVRYYTTSRQATDLIYYPPSTTDKIFLRHSQKSFIISMQWKAQQYFPGVLITNLGNRTPTNEWTNNFLWIFIVLRGRWMVSLPLWEIWMARYVFDVLSCETTNKIVVNRISGLIYSKFRHGGWMI